jgi:hypothetical protein
MQRIQIGLFHFLASILLRLHVLALIIDFLLVLGWKVI